MKCAECGRRIRTEPRFATEPTKGSRGWWRAIAKAAEAFGTPLMEWQKLGARLLGELDGGVPRYQTVIVSVPRQQGKTTLSHAAIDARARLYEGQRMFGTAQSRIYAARHLENLGQRLIGLDPEIQLRLGVGAERITWPNGSRFEVIAPNKGGGHGDSIDFMLVDEGWELTDVLLGGIRPAMIARPHAQMLVISTMGTVESETWNRLVARGRDAVDDPDASVAYVEYSAENDEDVFDEDTWHDYMPALGVTVTHKAIRAAMEDMEPAEIVRAFGNRTTQALVTLFPSDWVERAWTVIQPPPRFVLAVDVNDEPAGATVSTSHLTDDGRVAVRVVQWRYGTPRWIPELVERMVDERDVEAIVYDAGGPARELKPDLEAIAESRLVPLIDRKPRDFAADCARFYDALREGRVAIEKTEELEASIAAAQRKTLGDMWVISRRMMNQDASLLISVILAHGVAAELAASPPAGYSIHWF